MTITGAKGRAHHRYLGRGLQGRLHGPEQAWRPPVNAFLMKRQVLTREPVAVIVSFHPSGRGEGYTSFLEPAF